MLSPDYLLRVSEGGEAIAETLHDEIIKQVVYDYTYSDSDIMIERNGAMYSEALDPLNSGREYTETDVPIEVEEPTEE